jgi:hypothetical protein
MWHLTRLERSRHLYAQAQFRAYLHTRTSARFLSHTTCVTRTVMRAGVMPLVKHLIRKFVMGSRALLSRLLSTSHQTKKRLSTFAGESRCICGILWEPVVGFEPTACCLRNSCSATELRRHWGLFHRAVSMRAQVYPICRDSARLSTLGEYALMRVSIVLCHLVSSAPRGVSSVPDAGTACSTIWWRKWIPLLIPTLPQLTGQLRHRMQLWCVERPLRVGSHHTLYLREQIPFYRL